MILFGAFSTMVRDHYTDTAKGKVPTFRKKTTKKKIKVVIWSLPGAYPLKPQLIICVLELEKQKVENRDCNMLGLRRICWRVAGYTSKVTGFGMARVLH